jgi:hypothetical protein
VVFVDIGSATEAAAAGKLGCSERAVFAGREMDGIFLKRNWELGNLRFAISECRQQMASIQGTRAALRRDGKELFYLSAEGKMMAVSVRAGGNFEAGSPVTLFKAHLRPPISVLDRVSYDVTADGQKFLINTKVDEPNAAPLSVILNWASEMER